MKLFQYLNLSSTNATSNDPDLGSTRCHVVQAVPSLNENIFKETKLNQNGMVETSDLFNYKAVQPQPQYAELYKYNGLLSSDSSSSEEEYDLPKSSNKQKRIYKNCEYVVTNPIEPGEIEKKVKNLDSNDDTDDMNLNISSHCCMNSFLTTNCSIM